MSEWKEILLYHLAACAAALGLWAIGRFAFDLSPVVATWAIAAISMAAALLGYFCDAWLRGPWSPTLSKHADGLSAFFWLLFFYGLCALVVHSAWNKLWLYTASGSTVLMFIFVGGFRGVQKREGRKAACDQLAGIFPIVGIVYSFFLFLQERKVARV